MLKYPLQFSFKVIAFNPQVIVTDAEGNQALYIKQKALALKEDVKVFSDQSQSTLLYQIKANKVIDFSATYNFTDSTGKPLGSMKREGMKSIWKATYNILDASGAKVGEIREENAFLQFLDAVLSNIPFLGMIINPAYLIDYKGTNVLYLKKMPAYFEGKFKLESRAPIQDADESLLLPAIVMSMMLERLRG